MIAVTARHGRARSWDIDALELWIPITIAAFAAYAFAWMQFRGRDLLFAVVVAMLVVPLQMALIPVLRLYTGLDLNGTFLGVWLAHTGFGLPLAIFLM